MRKNPFIEEPDVDFCSICGIDFRYGDCKCEENPSLAIAAMLFHEECGDR